MNFLPKKMPSRKTIAFFGVAGSILAGLKYDQYKQSQICLTLLAEVEEFANDPLPIESLPTRVCLYILPSFDDNTTYRSEKYVKSFILPIFQKSGLDVRIANANTAEELKEMIKHNFKEQKTLPPFNLQWKFAKHIAIGDEVKNILLESEQEYYDESKEAARQYEIEFVNQCKKSWIFKPAYNPPKMDEPKIEELPLNVTKGFRQMHVTILNFFRRSQETLSTGSQVVELIKSLNKI
eukprot:NODE_39_length_35218_cov_0.479655.p24 type:complete len:237 gc:universal NODE_39_length_35218_cov_0.479655:17888-17178(-)